jgi:signal transduction histidine kinase/PAS domain-containing protein
MEDNLLDRSRSDFESYRNLPFAIYLTSNEGSILRANESAVALLKIESEDTQSTNISDYYIRPEDRRRLFVKLSTCDNESWLTDQEVSFNINGTKTILRYYVKVYKYKDVILGNLCIVFNVSEFETFHQFEDTIPVGLFEISGGRDNLITYRNKKFDSILGVEPDDGTKLNIVNYIYPAEKSKEIYIDVLKKLKEAGSLSSHDIDLIRRDGRSIVGRFNIFVQDTDENGNIARTRGVLEDITYTEIIDELPIGLFSIKPVNGRFQIVHCNKYFADIFSSGSIESCVGSSLSKLINNESSYNNLKNTLEELSNDNQEITSEKRKIENQHIVVNTGADQKDVILQLIKLPKRNGVQRYSGFVYDVTNDVDRILLQWKQDIEVFLHTFSSMCTSVCQTIYGIISGHGTEVVQKGRVNLELANKRLHSHLNSYHVVMKSLVEFADERFGKEISGEFHESLDFYHARIKLTQSLTMDKASVASIRAIFNGIRQELDSWDLMKQLPNEKKRPVHNEISEILRFSRLISLNTVVTEIIEMGVEMEELKQFILTDFKSNKPGNINILNPLREAVNNLHELALTKNIEIKIRSSFKQHMVKGNPRDLYLALYNVINNAIKYSWTKPDDAISRVVVEIQEQALFVVCTVTNRGVGITKEEINSRILFQWAHRGVSSSDRHRKGTGIGLWHTNKVIEGLGGTVEIESIPVDQVTPGDYSKPFITKITIKIPSANV